MNKKLTIAALLLLTGIGCWFFGGFGPGELVNYPPTATGPWIAFGDSLTAGSGADSGEDYPSVFSKLTGIKVQNLGIPGNTSQNGLARVEAAAKLKPKVVLLCLGGNDALQDIPHEVTSENLGKLIDRFHREGSFVILIGIQSGLRNKNPEYFEELAREKKVLLLDNILGGILTNGALKADRLHPNAKGYEKIAQRFTLDLATYLPQLR